jgi:hypothetical protein
MFSVVSLIKSCELPATNVRSIPQAETSDRVLASPQRAQAGVCLLKKDLQP